VNGEGGEDVEHYAQCSRVNISPMWMDAYMVILARSPKLKGMLVRTFAGVR